MYPKRHKNRWWAAFPMLALSGTLLAAPPQEQTPNVPTPFAANESDFQSQTHFLVFTGSDTPGETAQTAAQYYNAIDPTQSKRTFEQWLLNAGFISDVAQWHPTGRQLIACDLPQCDFPSHTSGQLTYGDNIINTDSHAIVLNAADLGFVRNQFVRCKPSCSARNPIIYTYLENYPVNPFALHSNGGSGFPIFTGYPTAGEAADAINSALNRPLGDRPGCVPATTKTDTALQCSIQRIADVAFEWAPPPTKPTSSTRYGQLYAYIFSADLSGIGDQIHTRETITVPPSGFNPNLANGKNTTPNVATHQLNVIGAHDTFPPNLDFLGFKQHPGVCFICHGGKPGKLTSTGAYPNQGNVSGFRFLPLDVQNLLFTSDLGAEPTSRINQERQLKAYNLAVLQTVTTQLENDGTGATRIPHLREVITGWYTDSGGPLFGRTTQNSAFIPVGWREATDGGTAPSGSEKLYQEVLGPSCRSCHFNREVSLDFGTYQNFKQESDLLQLALLPGCTTLRPGDYSPDPNAKYMPLAHLTYQRYWQANLSTGGTTITLPDGFLISDTADQIANYFGFGSVGGYCATNP